MNQTTTRSIVASIHSPAQETNDPPVDGEFERFTSAAAESSSGPVQFDDRIGLETRVYGLVLGAISSGMLGWLWIYASAGVSFLLS